MSNGNDEPLHARLDDYFRQVERIILSRQDPITGLLPASTAVTAHGDYTDAWVRDNVYSILAVWGLALAYRREEGLEGQAYQLEHSVVKLMRGLLTAMMKQADKVEVFKHTQNPGDALHAKYDTHTGEVVVGDDEWGHLQLDATSLFLLMLAQMTASGLHIVYTPDEVDFIQNLVFYVARTYCTPDYGIWERGNKINQGQRELNASSIGMAKAALEAMDGLQFFGGPSGRQARIHVIPDEIARTRISLYSILPRESNSKETDASLLSIIGYPAFAVEDRALADSTLEKVVGQLQGRYGCKRFLLDGHQTVVEDRNRLHYDSEELQQFAGIECEWPLFFAYLMLYHLFTGQPEKAAGYRKRLEALGVEQEGFRLLPELYYVPQEALEAERAEPGSQKRLPNENLPLVWAQSLYLLACLVDDGLLDPAEVDPLGRRLRLGHERQRPVQVAILAEDETVKARLDEAGIPAELPAEVAPLQLRVTEDLTLAFSRMGANEKLNLSGRPQRLLRPLTTSRGYQFSGQRMVFLPYVLSGNHFYLSHDIILLTEKLRTELSYIRRHWDEPGKPLFLLRVTATMLSAKGSERLLGLLHELLEGACDGLPVRVGRLQALLTETPVACLDYLGGFCFTAPAIGETAVQPELLPYRAEVSTPLPLDEALYWQNEADDSHALKALVSTENIYLQMELLDLLLECHGPDYRPEFCREQGLRCRIDTLLQELYERACRHQLWGLVRRSADSLGKNHPGLENALMEILAHQKNVAVGRAYSSQSVLRQPMNNEEIMGMIRSFCGESARERILTQELLLHLGLLIKAHPQLFEDMLTIRVSSLLLLLTAHLARERKVSLDAAYDELGELPPHELLERLKDLLAHMNDVVLDLEHVESLHGGERGEELVLLNLKPEDDSRTLGEARDWHHWRQIHGVIGRLPDPFFSGVRLLLERSRGLVIGDKLRSSNRLDSAQILSETTAGEKSFALRLEHRLNRIQAPEYRQLNIETLVALEAMLRANPGLRVDEELVLDVIIGHAVRLSWQDAHEDNGYYEDEKARAWEAFYHLPPYAVANAVARSLAYLVSLGTSESE